MQRAIFLSIPMLIFFSGCNQQAKLDSVKLDSILTNQHIDTVEIIAPTATNRLMGAEARKLIASLDKTNRIPHSDWSKQEVQSVVFLNGTNELWGLSLGEDGSWEF